VEGEVLLVGIAQLAIVTAGFAAVATGLRGQSLSPSQSVRLRAIVSTSFNVAFESLVPLIAFYWLRDTRAAVVTASALAAVNVAVVMIIRTPQLARAGALRARAGQFMVVAAWSAAVLFALTALVFGSVSGFAAALLLQLFVVAISFYTLVASSS
jgi:hypothetical protein